MYKAETDLKHALNKLCDEGKLKHSPNGDEYFEGDLELIKSVYNKFILFYY